MSRGLAWHDRSRHSSCTYYDVPDSKQSYVLFFSNELMLNLLQGLLSILSKIIDGHPRAVTGEHRLVCARWRRRQMKTRTSSLWYIAWLVLFILRIQEDASCASLIMTDSCVACELGQEDALEGDCHLRYINPHSDTLDSGNPSCLYPRIASHFPSSFQQI